jgi:septal ring factor EnvC (AmiA/AmiB activator)
VWSCVRIHYGEKRRMNFFDNILKMYESTEDHKSLGEKIQILEERIVKLEEENIETTNVLYEILNSIHAVDHRIDILKEND